MRINNVDAPEHLAEKIINLDVPQFVLDVVRPLEREFRHIMHESILMHRHFHFHTSGKVQLPHSPIRKFEHYHYENVANLLHTIPIYLRDSRPERCNETDIVDLLGAYFPNRNNDDPYIELYLTPIDKSSNGDDLHFKWLFTKVLIHELAHAALDIFNCEHCRQSAEKVTYDTKFGKWREESMANAVALRIIKEYRDQDFYDFAKQFMLSQPAEYALGVLMEDFKYRDLRSVTDGKEDGVHSDLKQEWLKYVQGNPVWGELQRWNEILSSRTIYNYNNRYYTDHQDLVLDIIQDYICKQGQISFAQLCATFPNVKVQSKEAYRPLASVLDDSQFYTDANQVLHLSDGDFALYKYWYNDDLAHILNSAKSYGFIINTLNNY